MGVAKKRKHKIGNRSTVCEFKYFQTLPVSNDVPNFSEKKAQDSHDVSPIVFARAHIYGAVFGCPRIGRNKKVFQNMSARILSHSLWS